MSKIFKFNWDRLPKEVRDKEVANAFKAFVVPLNIGISEERYNELEDWIQTYWKLDN